MHGRYFLDILVRENIPKKKRFLLDIVQKGSKTGFKGVQTPSKICMVELFQPFTCKCYPSQAKVTSQVSNTEERVGGVKATFKQCPKLTQMSLQCLIISQLVDTSHSQVQVQSSLVWSVLVQSAILPKIGFRVALHLYCSFPFPSPGIICMLPWTRESQWSNSKNLTKKRTCQLCMLFTMNFAICPKALEFNIVVLVCEIYSLLKIRLGSEKVNIFSFMLV